MENYGRHDAGRAEHYRQSLETIEQMEHLGEKLDYLPEQSYRKIMDSLDSAKRWYKSELRNLENLENALMVFRKKELD